MYVFIKFLLVLCVSITYEQSFCLLTARGKLEDNVINDISFVFSNPHAFEDDNPIDKGTKSEVAKKLLQLEPGKILIPEVFDNDLKRLQAVYGDGCVEYMVLPAHCGGSNLIFMIQEYPTITGCVIEGLECGPKSKVQAQVDAVLWKKVSTNDLSILASNIKGLYLKEGFFEVEVDAEVKSSNDSSENNLVVNIKEGSKGFISKIQIFGVPNRREYLAARMSLSMRTYRGLFPPAKALGIPTQQLLDAGITEMYRALRSFGYANAHVKCTMTQGEYGYVVSFFVDLGEKYSIKNISCSGNVLVSDAELMAVVNPFVSKEYSEDVINLISKSVQSVYADRGFVKAKIIPGVSRDVDQKQVSVNVAIEENKQYRVGGITVSNNLCTQNDVILNSVSLLPGQVLTSTLIRDNYISLMKTALFKSVDIKYSPATDVNDMCDVNISVDEKVSGRCEAMLGGGSTVLSMSAYLSMTNFNHKGIFDFLNTGVYDTRNFTGGGEELLCLFKIAPNSYSTTLKFSKPWFLGTKNKCGFNIKTAAKSVPGLFFMGKHTPIELCTLFLKRQIGKYISLQVDSGITKQGSSSASPGFLEGLVNMNEESSLPDASNKLIERSQKDQKNKLVSYIKFSLDYDYTEFAIIDGSSNSYNLSVSTTLKSLENYEKTTMFIDMMYNHNVEVVADWLLFRHSIKARSSVFKGDNIYLFQIGGGMFENTGGSLVIRGLQKENMLRDKDKSVSAASGLVITSEFVLFPNIPVRPLIFVDMGLACTEPWFKNVDTLDLQIGKTLSTDDLKNNTTASRLVACVVTTGACIEVEFPSMGFVLHVGFGYPICVSSGFNIFDFSNTIFLLKASVELGL